MNTGTCTQWAHLNRRVEDFLRLHRHFPFFFGEAVVHEGVDMGIQLKAISLVNSSRTRLSLTNTTMD